MKPKAAMRQHIEPLDRGDRYEDPLQATLEKVGIGRVTGGGSQPFAQLQRILNTAAPDSHRTFAVSQKN
jgi:hypothetical protein